MSLIDYETTIQKRFPLLLMSPKHLFSSTSFVKKNNENGEHRKDDSERIPQC